VYYMAVCNNFDCKQYSDFRQSSNFGRYTLDKTVCLDQHINNIVMNCNYHLQAFRHIRPSITNEVANTMVCAITGS